MMSRFRQREEELPFPGEADEAPLFAMRARREYSRRTEGFPAPAEDENPYQVAALLQLNQATLAF